MCFAGKVGIFCHLMSVSARSYPHTGYPTLSGNRRANNSVIMFCVKRACETRILAAKQNIGPTGKTGGDRAKIIAADQRDAR